MNKQNHQTLACRVRESDRDWIIHRRGSGTSADVINNLIIFYEQTNKLIKTYKIPPENPGDKK